MFSEKENLLVFSYTWKKAGLFTRAHTHTTEAVGIFPSPLVPEILVPV